MITKAFCDGGVVKINPSPYAGTWAYVLLIESADQEPMELFASGHVTPQQIGLPTISNNYTELLAAVEAMERLPDGWDGTIYTDSHVTECRLVNKSPSFKGITISLHDRVWAARKRLGAFKVILLDGHPTKKQLAAGVGKRGHPVSKWNCRADELCGIEAERFEMHRIDSL